MPILPQLSPRRQFLRSYPTYEEWKPETSFGINLNIVCSYPTYEEWKHGTGERVTLEPGGSYPTYEEWKPLLPQ